ncbi:Myosin type-2 heavy chain 2 [Escovopsis weberi]|uniref:Myosin type-2 heavy chain 2 n=1 Tax=Escovopsis weberi TaxID=150374 RepID=A0A0N0RTS9_ESCWE|nr:Myosin type-2 heavy chain 2 [Escovopsis weberi]
MSFNSNSPGSGRNNPFMRSSKPGQAQPTPRPRSGLFSASSTPTSSPQANANTNANGAGNGNATPSTNAFGSSSITPTANANANSNSNSNHIIPSPLAHIRTRSNTGSSFDPGAMSGLLVKTARADSRNGTPTSSTFAPSFIREEEDMRQENESVKGIEGENDFSGKRYVWLKDPQEAFVKCWVVEELGDNKLLVQVEDGALREVDAEGVDKVNPAKFDKANDIAELTHLNEASVVHNLLMRYQSDLIYTYSGLFLVTVNPYCPLPIYNDEYVNRYRGRSRDDTKPHIFAMADQAFRNLVGEGRNQSILVTGESGAGKTENTKKVIHYLAAVAQSDSPAKSQEQHSNLSQQILRANPILEAFGNAQTVRNNNSSRFGKFIRIEFSREGAITGAFIEWFLFEKSRVVRVNAQERNYHIFYQLLKGADAKLRKELLLEGLDIGDFAYTRNGHDSVIGVSDQAEWDALLEAFDVIGFSQEDQLSILRTIAAVLHLGNIEVIKESRTADQARLSPEAQQQAAKVCKLLGVSLEPFLQGLLHPKVKAGREWVEKVQTPEQVRLGLDALAKGIYERGFGDLVTRINRQLDRAGMGHGDSHYIGVLDIAGFEIFERNSFEQLCINYTNEKLQQFFNHHMFVLEQEEYAREKIEWQFIDFGRDLQPTIDLIELPNPIGIFSCLDEDCVMPKATDKSFTEKLNSLWDKKSTKYRPSRLGQGFILTHYAAEVEYSTEDWLEKNKDPLNDNITRLLADSTHKHIVNLFADCADPEDDRGGVRSRVKKGLFRTVAQRHKEQLHNLMAQLKSTHPHFVRCILPNHKKRPKQFDKLLVLDQLRCNGVLEGIRIARTGFPNRLSFTEFRQRYEVLCPDLPVGNTDGQFVAAVMLERLALDKTLYRVGLTKVFFRAGVLAELEEQRDSLITQIMSSFQSVARGFMRRRSAYKRLFRTEATRIIQRNFEVYLNLVENPWWQLIVKMKPLLGATRSAAEVKKRDAMIQELSDRMQQEVDNRQRIEEDRRNCLSEISRIQQTLESERALALDKEEIFKRLQAREAELEEKLAGAIEDQERIDDQLDDLMEAKNRAESDVERFRAQLEQAATLIAKLEEEKGKLSNRAADLENAIEDLAKKQAERTEKEATMEGEIKMLQSQLALKDRKAKDLEMKLLSLDQDAEVKLHVAQKDLEAAKARETRLVQENNQVHAQLKELTKTSTDYEDLVRTKESELSLLRDDKRKSEVERRSLEDQKKALTEDIEKASAKFRDVQAEFVALKSKQTQLEREAEDAKTLLEARLSEDAQADKNRQVLESQIKDLKDELYKTQMDLSRERQSRDDVLLLGEHKLQALKDDYDHLNESKIIIEKELYLQQDTLRRTIEARAAVEKERDEARDEIRKLRIAKTQAEEARVQAEMAGEREASKAARERENSLRKDLEAAQGRLQWFEEEVAKLNHHIEDLNKLVLSSGEFGLKNDQAKERLERELVTIKSRLAASENDNKSLLNKLQQKGLEIARSNSKASEANRGQILTLRGEKTRLEEHNNKLNKQLGEAQVSIASLEKRLEKLNLNVEDLNHEVAREAKASRNAEKSSSSFSAQLSEANRTIDSERQMRNQAQSTVRTLQASVDTRDKELEDLRAQMLRVLKMVDPEVHLPSSQTNSQNEKAEKALLKNFDLVRMVEELQQKLRVQSVARTNAEAQLTELRATSRDQIISRPKLEDLQVGDVSFQGTSPKKLNRNSVRFSSTTPVRRFQDASMSDTSMSDRGSDVGGGAGLKSEVEELQSQLQLAQMQNRQLQIQLDRSAPTPDAYDDGPSILRMQKLEKANNRLHEQLDDSVKKMSALEKNAWAGELSLRDIQARSHEELLDMINSQEDSRRSLLHTHKDAIAELTDVKGHFDKMRHERAKLEVELRDALADLAEMTAAREQESQSRSQLLQEVTDLQIRLDTESSRVVDVTSSLEMYRNRADEYFSKLEQAEMAVLKANRAEAFAKSQAKDAEDTYAEVMSERHRMDAMIEDLQGQNHRLEGRVEDLSTDLEAAMQAKKRLQHELEDYRNQRAMEIEDKESSMEQTRKKYQAEFATLASELDLAREEKLFKQAEITRLREELDELRAKWDDEVLNSSTWSKEKARLEATLADVAQSRDETVNAHNEAQGRIVTLLSQVRSLRSSVDELTTERDLLVREKRSVEARLQEAKAGLDELARGENPSLRSAANMDREVLNLRSNLAQQEDIALAAVEKMRRAEALVSEIQKEVIAEREVSAGLQKQRLTLEKSLNEAQLKIVDLETKGYSSASQDIKFLNKRIQELESQLESQEAERTKEQRSVRNVDRVVKDLQGQIDRKDKQNAQLSDDVNRMRDKVDKLLRTIDELQASESTNQLSARRAERELREEKERSLRLDRELEGWKNLRMDKTGGAGGGGNGLNGVGSGLRSRWKASNDGDESVLSSDGLQRNSSLSRAPSMTKGFL